VLSVVFAGQLDGLFAAAREFEFSFHGNVANS
jgi:hypothetical protein